MFMHHASQCEAQATVRIVTRRPVHGNPARQSAVSRVYKLLLIHSES
jgi:hypothetical protein